MFTAPYVLFADDDPDDLDMLVAAFKEQNPEIQVSTTLYGQEVINRLEDSSKQNLPVLVVLDYKMPDMNAPEILAYLLRNPECHRIPRFVWSAALRIDHANECKALGAKAYFTKPVDAAELAYIVTQLSDAATTFLRDAHLDHR